MNHNRSTLMLALGAMSLCVLTTASCAKDEEITVDTQRSDSDTASAAHEDTGIGTDIGTDTGTDTDTTPATGLVFGACPNYIEVMPGMGSECAFADLPLDYAKPDGAKIPIFLYRLPATAETRRGQIWFLQGGPGGSGADFAMIFAVYRQAFPEWDLYSLDHRGVGNSARLSCSQEAAAYSTDIFDFRGCATELEAEWGADLAAFNVTNAARDVSALIKATKAATDEVIVYGVSYGTYWAERFLQVAPTQADGVVLDSICAPGACQLDTYDRNFNENGKRIMEVCATDETCAARLGEYADTPWEALGKVFAAADKGTLCAPLAGLDRRALRMAFASLETDSMLRVVIPPAIYRTLRCNAADQQALESLLALFSEQSAGAGFAPEPLQDSAELEASLTLGTNIIQAELTGDLTYDEVVAIDADAFFSAGAGPQFAEIRDSGVWPRYPQDEFVGKFSGASIPLLMLNGDLDPQTTLAMAQPAKEHHTQAHQTFVTVKWSPHGVLFASHTKDSIASFAAQRLSYLTGTCGFQLFDAFVEDPSATLDTSCADNTYPLEFSADSVLNKTASKLLFGTSDMWDGTPVPAPQRAMRPFFVNPVARPFPRFVR